MCGLPFQECLHTKPHRKLKDGAFLWRRGKIYLCSWTIKITSPSRAKAGQFCYQLLYTSCCFWNLGSSPGMQSSECKDVTWPLLHCPEKQGAATSDLTLETAIVFTNMLSFVSEPRMSYYDQYSWHYGRLTCWLVNRVKSQTLHRSWHP